MTWNPKTTAVFLFGVAALILVITAVGSAHAQSRASLTTSRAPRHCP
jgi:hypothetical protein